MSGGMRDKILLHNAMLIDPENRSQGLGSVLIEDGKIKAVSYETANGKAGGKTQDIKNTKDAETIDCHGHYLAPGIIDIGVKVCEPGERHKESFRSAGFAAAAGGITTIVIRPDTHPAIDTPESLTFIVHRADHASAVKVLPLAALTKGRLGQEMAEIGFLKDMGAVGFSDCDHVVVDNKIFARALAYADSQDALVITHAQDPSLSLDAAATSGVLATKLGLPAVSVMAERLQLERDVAVLEMTNARIHIDQISTAVALPVLARAKADKLRITAGVSIHHLTLNELDIEGFGSFFKLKPPLRAEDDRMAMVAALANGLIDIVGSFHTPQDEESKRLPFATAASGAVGLETFLPALMQVFHSGVMAMPDLWRAVSLHPAQLLGLESGRLSVGAPADLVVFDADKPFVLDRTKLLSKSKNTPFDGHKMQGQVLHTMVNGHRVYPL